MNKEKGSGCSNENNTKIYKCLLHIKKYSKEEGEMVSDFGICGDRYFMERVRYHFYMIYTKGILRI
jgi:hypothetical protein